MIHSLLTPALIALTSLGALLPASQEAQASAAPREQSFSAPELPGDVQVSVVQARATDQWSLTLSAGQLSTIVVDGDGDTDLDLYLYDENWNLIDSDTDLTDYCVVSVSPRWTGTFYARIVNLGDVYNRYTISVR